MARISFSISRKIYTGIAILVLGYSLSMAFVMLSGYSSQQQMGRITDFYFPAASLSKEAQDAFVQENKDFEDAVLIGDPSKLELAKIKQNRLISSLEKLSRLDIPQSEYAELIDLSQKIRIYTKDALATYGPMAKAVQVPQSAASDLNLRSRELSGKIDALVLRYDSRLKAEVDSYNRSFGVLRRVTLLILIFVVIPAVVLMVIILAGVIRRINGIVERMKFLTDGEGNLDARLAWSMEAPSTPEKPSEEHSGDELALLALNFGRMVSALHESFKSQQQLLETLEERNSNLASAEEKLQARLDETITLQKELEILNSTLEARVTEELAKNREKDLLMIHQSRLAALGEMLSNIAHQWRQPLHELSCMIQMLQYDLPPESRNLPALDEFTGRGMEIIRFMSRTIEDFRNFFLPSRKAEQFDAFVAISNAISLVQTSFRSSGIEIESDCDPDCTIFGHSSEISQVLLNIINNARDALLQNQVENPGIFISSLSQNGTVTIKVEDNAGGIPEEIIGRIFEPYFTTKEKSKGTGLGLYMSKMIIERNGKGTISVVNGPEGAIFTITLPASDGDGGVSDEPV